MSLGGFADRGRLGCPAKRWTIAAPLDQSVPALVPSAAPHDSFGPRGEGDVADTVLSVLHYQFGGHVGKYAAQTGVAR